MIFSLVVPVYRNETSIPDLVASLEDLSRRMDGELEAVLVVDGSPDRSLELLRQALASAGFRAQLLALSRNFGAFAAVTAGLSHAGGDLFGVMAADLQEPPELILDFRRLLLSGEYDVVVGIRTARADAWSQRLASGIFWRAYRWFVQREIPPGGVDVFACTRELRDHLLSLRESNSTLVGLLFWLGFRRGEVRYERRARGHGRSAWSFARRLRYLLDSAFAFTDLPLRVLSIAGFTGVVFSIVLASVVFVADLAGREVPGYASTILTVMFFGALNSLGLGIIGEYLWRTFENTKGRPTYIVARHERFEK